MSESVRAFRARRRATLARRRVNGALDRWAEVEAAAAMPAELRPDVAPPTLGHQALQELQAVLAGVDEREESGERLVVSGGRGPGGGQ